MKYYDHFIKINKEMSTLGQVVYKVYENGDSWIFIGGSKIPKQVIYGNAVYRVFKKDGKTLPFYIFSDENYKIIKRSKVIFDSSKNTPIEKKDNYYVIKKLN